MWSYVTGRHVRSGNSRHVELLNQVCGATQQHAISMKQGVRDLFQMHNGWD